MRLEQLNLLNNEGNCLESSTAFGFLIEEFLVSKLDDYTLSHDGINGYRVRRTNEAVTRTSYDCVADIRNGIRALINIKICRRGGVANDCVAAIHQLYHDYVDMDPDVRKCFLILKVDYSFCNSIRNGSKGERAISICGIDSFFLDEVDFSREHKQDNRKWSSAGGNANSGRLMISKRFRDMHQLLESQLSYMRTVGSLRAICARNEGKNSRRI